jgi:tetratricopeptide (TPR) repeat protein
MRLAVLPALVLAVLAAGSARAAGSPAMAKGIDLYAAGNFAAAAPLFEAIVARAPDDLDANYYLGQTRVAQGDPDRAIACLEHCVALAPGDARSENGLGDAYGLAAQKAGLFSKWGLAKKCLAAYQRAVALAPANVSYHLSLLNYFIAAPALAGGGNDRAQAEVAEIMGLSPVDGHRELGILKAKDGQTDEALREFHAALALDPNDYGALYGIGRLAATTGQVLSEGHADLERCRQLKVPDDMAPRSAVAWRLGNIEERLGHPAQARADYEAALREDATFQPAADALQKLGGAGAP